MKIRKIIKIVIIFICLIFVLLAVLFGYFYAWFTDSRVYGFSYYYNCEIYSKYYYSSLDSSIYFSKKHYYEEAGKEHIIQMNLIQLGKDKVEKVKSYFSTSLNKLYEFDDIIIDFNYDIITPDDYYFMRIIDDKVHLQYYDMNENILYVTSFPNKYIDIVKN